MDINLTSPNGIKLKTAGTYCSQDVNVIPQWGTVTAKPSESEQVFTPDGGRAGISQATVEAIPDEYIEPSGTQQITENGTYNIADKKYVSVEISSEQPTLFAPSISLNGSIVTIAPASENGSFATGYKIYSGTDLLVETEDAAYDLSQTLTTTGTYVITVKATGTNFNDSAASDSVTYTLSKELMTPVISLISEHTIQVDTIDPRVQTIQVAYLSASGGLNTFGRVSKQSGTDKQTIDLSTLSGWGNVPIGTNSIVIRTDASGYTSVRSNAVSVTIPYYNIITNLTNISAAASNPTAIRQDGLGNDVLTFTSATKYKIPESVTVVGAEFSWEKTTGSKGRLVLRKPVSDVTITIAGVEIVGGHEVVVTMREQGAYATDAAIYTDDEATKAIQGQSALVFGLYSYGDPCTVYAQNKIYIDATYEWNTEGWDGGSANATVTGGVTLTASDRTSATFSVTGDGTITTDGITD